MEITATLNKFTGVSKKTGKQYTCFVLSIGDYETYLFPRSKMEINYLTRIVEHGDE